MADVPQRIWARTGTYETVGVWNVIQDWSGDAPYILASPEALAAAPEVQALIRAAKAEGMREAARICRDYRNAECTPYDEAVGAMECASAILAAAEKLERG